MEMHTTAHSQITVEVREAQYETETHTIAFSYTTMHMMVEH